MAAGRVSRRPGENRGLVTQADHQRHISLCSSIELGPNGIFSLDRHSRVGLPKLTGLNLSASALTGATLVLLYMRSSLETIVVSISSIERARIALEKIKDLGLSLREQMEASDSTDAPEAGYDLVSLELSGVSYGYYSDEHSKSFVLGPLI